MATSTSHPEIATATLPMALRFTLKMSPHVNRGYVVTASDVNDNASLIRMFPNRQKAAEFITRCILRGWKK